MKKGRASTLGNAARAAMDGNRITVPTPGLFSVGCLQLLRGKPRLPGMLAFPLRPVPPELRNLLLGQFQPTMGQPGTETVVYFGA